MGPAIGYAYFFIEFIVLHLLAALLIVVCGGCISIIAWQGWQGFITIAFMWLVFNDVLSGSLNEPASPDPSDKKRAWILFLLPLTAVLLGFPVSWIESFLHGVYETGPDSDSIGFFAIWGVHTCTGLWAGMAMHWFAKKDLLLDARKMFKPE